MAEYVIVGKEPDNADSLCLQGAFLTNESDDGTGGSGRLNNNQLAIVATHRGADASMIARACIDDANVLPCLSIQNTTTTHPQLTSLKRVLRAKAGCLRSAALAVRCGGPRAALDLRLRFLVYQVFKAVQKLEQLGELSARTVFVTDDAWCRVLPTIAMPRPLPMASPTARWVDGSLSTFDYLLILNRAAGRSTALTNDHYVFPWVSDFSVKHGGWRDLSKTKFRIAKGDELLDRTYQVSKHHVSDPGLSDLALCIYLARRAPLSVLKSVVRTNFVPEHYPATMERLYAWSPDECIPEFYCDPTVFTSQNALKDLEVPSWCASPEDFVKYHRELLESQDVSKHIHLWIDLTFGINATGPASVRERNCPLVVKGDAYRGSRVSTSSPGAARLFSVPHPRRAVSSPSKLEGVSILETYLDGTATSVTCTSLRQFSDRDAIESVDACLTEGSSPTTTPGKCAALLRSVYGFGDEQAVLAPAPSSALRIAAALATNNMDVGGALQDTDFFPASFHEAHAVGCTIEGACDKGRATSSLDAFSSLEFAGALLVLPQMLQGLESDMSASNLATIVDVVGSKIGASLAYDVLAPRVASFIERRKADAAFLRDASQVVASLHKRAGPRSIALVLPSLMEASRKSTNAMTLLTRLVDALGPCLTARFVLPALVADIGRPELEANDGRARAIVSLCDTLTVEAAAPLVLDPLLNPRGRLAQLEGEIGGASTQSRRALTEVVSVLKAIVGRVAPETVTRFYVDLPPSPLPSLLSCLTPSPDAISLSDDPFAVAAEARKALDDVAELIALIAMVLGAQLTCEKLLPDVDRFFAQLVPLRRAPSAAAAALASDVAAGLYAPLSALCGVEEARLRCPAYQRLAKDAMPPTPPPPPKRRESNLLGDALNAGADWLQRQGEHLRTPQPPAKNSSPVLSRTKGMELSALRDTREDSSDDDVPASPMTSGSITDDRLWLLPRGRPLLDERPWEGVDEPYKFGFRLAATPLMDTAATSSSILCVDPLESTVLCGGKDGIVRIWSLRQHPPKLEGGHKSGNAVRSLCCLDGDGSSLKAVSTDGLQVDYWDVGRAATIERRAFEKRSIVDLCPVALGYGPGGAFEQGRSARQLVVLGEGQSINRIFAAARSPPP